MFLISVVILDYHHASQNAAGYMENETDEYS